MHGNGGGEGAVSGIDRVINRIHQGEHDHFRGFHIVVCMHTKAETAPGEFPFISVGFRAGGGCKAGAGQ